MEQLSYRTLEQRNFQGYLLRHAPERVLQFGEGNFLRAFVEEFIDVMNERAGFDGKVVLVQPIAPGLEPVISRQEGLYTLLLRGREEGRPVSQRRVISCVSRCINPYEDYRTLLDCAKIPELRFLVSNTTEAGIVFDPVCRFDDEPSASFPGKLTRFLYERYRLGGKGFIILPCELIDRNGDMLRRCVERYISHWELDTGFSQWVARENVFCSTLVDRIVTGYPRVEAETICAELGYEDSLLDAGELFGLWVIEGPQSIKEELPFEQAGLPIIVTDDLTPYQRRKVRVLNGAHTAMSLGAYLIGHDMVRSCMENSTIRGFMGKAVYQEIIPTLDLPGEELNRFAASVIERFQNPYIDHRLLDISLNSTAKWRARIMPSLLEFAARTGTLPTCLIFSFAEYLSFYHGGRVRGEGCLIGRRGEDRYQVKDDPWVLDFYYDHRDDRPAALVHAVVSNERMWGLELSALPGFEAAVTRILERIAAMGMYRAMQECL